MNSSSGACWLAVNTVSFLWSAGVASIAKLVCKASLPIDGQRSASNISRPRKLLWTLSCGCRDLAKGAVAQHVGEGQYYHPMHLLARQHLKPHCPCSQHQRKSKDQRR